MRLGIGSNFWAIKNFHAIFIYVFKEDEKRASYSTNYLTRIESRNSNRFFEFLNYIIIFEEYTSYVRVIK